jgi:hypothetical protein
MPAPWPLMNPSSRSERGSRHLGPHLPVGAFRPAFGCRDAAWGVESAHIAPGEDPDLRVDDHPGAAFND